MLTLLYKLSLLALLTSLLFSTTIRTNRIIIFQIHVAIMHFQNHSNNRLAFDCAVPRINKPFLFRRTQLIWRTHTHFIK